MMSLTTIILRMRDKCPIFENRVGGTMSFSIAAGGEQSDGQGDTLETPHAFVVPMSDSTEPSTGNSSAQWVSERFAVVVCVSNDMADGATADDLIRMAREQMIQAFFGWRPTNYAQRVSYLRGVHLDMNNRRVWHQLEWETGYYVNSTNQNDDLEEVLVDGTMREVIDEVITRYGLTEEGPDGKTQISPHAVESMLGKDWYK